MSEIVRVLIVLGRLDRGGAENMVMNLYRKIDRNKVQFDFVIHTNKHCAFTDEVLKLGGRIYSVPRYNVKNHLEYKKAWNDFFKEHKEYRIIHGHMFTTSPIYLKIAKKYGLTTVAHSHCASVGKGFQAVVKRLMLLPLKNIADWLFACSDKAGRWLYGDDVVNKENYFLLKNAIETEKYVYNSEARMKIRNEFGIQNKLVFGHIGRFTLQKNHMYLLEIFKKICDKNKDSILLIIGEGELRKQIEGKIDELGLKENVILTGVRSDVTDLLQAMDCFLLPSFYEGLPVTVVEAQAAGLKCFVADTVTTEVCITDLIKMLPINVSPDVWVDEIFGKEVSFEHADTKQQIIDAGYDISSTSKWLQNFYLKESK